MVDSIPPAAAGGRLDADEPLTIFTKLPPELIALIVTHTTDDVALSSMCTLNKSMHELLAVKPSPDTPSMVERRLTQMALERGWRATAPMAQSLIGEDDESVEAASRPPRTPLPTAWEASQPFSIRYGSRVRSLPAPHASWPVDGGRVLSIGARAGQIPTLRAALDLARDHDTILLSEGVHDEGPQPIEVQKSVRIVGAVGGGGGGGVSTERPRASILKAQIVAKAGRGALCGLTLILPSTAAPGPSRVADIPPLPPLPGPDPQVWEMAEEESSRRCFHVTGHAIWTLEDCAVHGGVRTGSCAELAVIGCAIVGDNTAPPSTGVLVQGVSRVLMRATRLMRHKRSGITAQQSGSVFLHCCVSYGNGLAGVKLLSRSPCVLSCCSISRNGHMGLMARDKAAAYLIGCELLNNFSGGAVVINTASVRLWQCMIAHNHSHGFICHHASSTSLSASVLSDNLGFGVTAAHEARVSLKRVTCTRNREGGVETYQTSKVETVGQDNYVSENGPNASADAPSPERDLAATPAPTPASTAQRSPHSPRSPRSRILPKHVGPHSKAMVSERSTDLAAWHWAMDGSEPFDDEHEATAASISSESLAAALAASISRTSIQE